MALNKTQLKTDIKAILDDMATRDTDPAQAREDYSTQLADAIDAFVKTAAINYINGLTAGGNNVIGTFNGNLT